jgi:regulator of replication initiation timing
MAPSDATSSNTSAGIQRVHIPRVPWLVFSVFWRAPRAVDRYAAGNCAGRRAHHIYLLGRTAVQGSQRMTKQAVARTVDLEPIDRLEEKVKLLVGMIAQLRAEQSKSVHENARLMEEIESLRGRLTEAEIANSELAALRVERDLIRTRVTEMLEQLEAI